MYGMQQEQALNILKAGKNVFLTGSAGAGKTYVLNQYIDYLREHSVGVGITASTGIAATHIGGMTIHAWSGIGIKDHLTQKDIDILLSRQQIKKRMRQTRVLIIDEVSMLGAHVIDMIDQVCRAFKDEERPFGGLQVVFCGDFFQLPPVAGRRTEVGEDFSYDDPFFAAEASSWHAADIHVCYLSTQYRHEDDALTEILNAMRRGEVDEDIHKSLRRRINAPIIGDIVPTRLYTHNVDVDQINSEQLQSLDTEGRRYIMTHDGKERLAEVLQRSCLAPEELIVRIGAAVMFVKNNFDEGYANGTLGTVVRFTERGFPVVQTFDKKEIVAEPAVWEIEEDDVPIASIKQIPLRLAWAITVHKSQGMTLDAAVIDVSKSFVSGMGYVALSRVRSLKTLSLVGFNDAALMIEERVRDLDSVLRSCADDAEAWIVDAMDSGTITQEHASFLASAKKLIKKSTYERTREMLVQKMAIEDIASLRGLTAETIIGHIEKLCAEDDSIDISYIANGIDEETLKEIERSFTDDADMKLGPAHRRLGEKYSYEQLRLVRLCLIKGKKSSDSCV